MMTKKSEKIELKPCPFCGHKNFVISELWEIDAHEIKCTACGASVKEPYSWNKRGDPLVWNKRPIEDKLNEQIAELKAKLESVLEVNLKFRSVCYHLLTEGGEKLHDVLVAWKALEDSEDGCKAVKDWYQKHRDVLGNESESDGNE